MNWEEYFKEAYSKDEIYQALMVEIKDYEDFILDMRATIRSRKVIEQIDEFLFKKGK